MRRDQAWSWGGLGRLSLVRVAAKHGQYAVQGAFTRSSDCPLGVWHRKPFFVAIMLKCGFVEVVETAARCLGDCAETLNLLAQHVARGVLKSKDEPIVGLRE